jgi:hypothetical protein
MICLLWVTYPQDIALLRIILPIHQGAKNLLNVANPLDPDQQMPANRMGKVPRTGV